MGNFIDYSNRKFSNILVTSTFKRRGTRTFWLCICDCGKELWIRNDSLNRKYHRCACNANIMTPNGPSNNLSGKTFGHVTVTDLYKRIKSMTHWLCLCACGNERWFREDCLKRGKDTISCGCKRHLYSYKRYNLSTKDTRYTYRSWEHMKDRVLNSKHPHYKHYGGRGISICDSWYDFDNFYKDMGDRPKGYSLDRIDNNKGYYKENCKWSTTSEQNLNKSNSIKITYNNITKNIYEWADDLGMPYQTIYSRFYRNLPIEKILYPRDSRFINHKKTVNCLLCGKKFRITPASTQKYCNRDCMAKSFSVINKKKHENSKKPCMDL